MSVNNAGLPNQPDKLGGKPLRTTILTSGTGTYTPMGRNTLIITMVGGGGGGGRSTAG